MNATEMLKWGFSLIPVHKPINGGCTCGKKECPSIGKHPIPPAWQKVTSNNPEAIKAWDRSFKGPNWGVVTGKASGVVVLDIDPKNGGFDTIDDLQVKYGRIPDTATVETGSGGRHFYFKDPGGLKNAVNIGGSGVDFRGDNGFVVSPGSKHKSGKHYDWYDGEDPDSAGFAELPRWIFDLVYKPPVKQVEIGTAGAKVMEGGRNVWLASLAGVIRNKGVGYRGIVACLIEANLECCSPPLEMVEIEIIAKSISKYQITGGMKL